MENIERWTPIPGYEGIYEASSLGRIKSLARTDGSYRKVKERILKPRLTCGYPTVTLFKLNVPINYRKVHRLVMESFIGKSHLQVDHLNGNKSDNRLENLEYVTGRENSVRYCKINSPLKTGVSARSNGKFRARARFHGKDVHLGTYKTEDEAHQAYVNFCTEHGV